MWIKSLTAMAIAVGGDVDRHAETRAGDLGIDELRVDKDTREVTTDVHGLPGLWRQVASERDR
ncbi:MAG: hypothetical protein Q4G67_14555 [Actinomycetia bacterium]|nr:hypothetical protein [Actinomycetes bacterium]